MSATTSSTEAVPECPAGSATATSTVKESPSTVPGGAVKTAVDVRPGRFDSPATTPGPDQVWVSWLLRPRPSTIPVAVRVTPSSAASGEIT